jgi:hypothetical protein
MDFLSVCLSVIMKEYLWRKMAIGAVRHPLTGVVYAGTKNIYGVKTRITRGLGPLSS